ncbi:MAG: hypothetical protein K9N11_08265 [Lentisphaeria bacterium]|nr:hypothetical protein [Lentisphaeria bacterium]
MKLKLGITGLLCLGILSHQALAQQESGKYGPVAPENLPAAQINKTVDHSGTTPTEGTVTSGYDKSLQQLQTTGTPESASGVNARHSGSVEKVRPASGVSDMKGREKSKPGVKQKISTQKSSLEKSDSTPKAPEPEKRVQ